MVGRVIRLQGAHRDNVIDVLKGPLTLSPRSYISNNAINSWQRPALDRLESSDRLPRRRAGSPSGFATDLGRPGKLAIA